MFVPPPPPSFQRSPLLLRQVGNSSPSMVSASARACASRPQPREVLPRLCVLMDEMTVSFNKYRWVRRRRVIPAVIISIETSRHLRKDVRQRRTTKKGTANPTQSGRRPRVGSLESGLKILMKSDLFRTSLHRCLKVSIGMITAVMRVVLLYPPVVPLARTYAVTVGERNH